MKRTNRFFAFALACAMMLALLPLSGLAASTALQGKTIVAVGDSLTDYGGDYAYASVLSQSDYLGTPVVNAGVGGDTTRLVMNRFDKDVLALNPDVVTICLGMNDQACLIASKTPNTPFETYREHLTYFATELKKIDCDVIFVTPQPVVVGEGFYPEGGGEYGLDYGYGFMDDFCNIMREVALDTDSQIVDINYECDFVDVKQIVSSDGIHQTNYGRQQYAKYIADGMLAIYDNQNKATMTIKAVDEEGKLLRTYTISGKAGSHIIVPSPEIAGYTTTDADVPTTYVNGATFTFTYSFALSDLVEEAMSATYNEYGTKAIALIRDEIKNANALIADESASTEDILACYATLKELLNIKGTENHVLSVGADYTATAPNRGDGNIYNDDGTKLTDGNKGYADGSKECYSGWNNTAVEVIVDLGSVTKADYFSVYCASSQWGIQRPNNLTVSVSADGISYTEIGTQTSIKNVIETTDGWDTSIISVIADTPVNVRYAKFVMNPNGPHTWIDEVEVAVRPNKVYGAIGVTGINEKILTNSCSVFTPDFGTITADNANHKYTANAIAKWDHAVNGYIVTSAALGNGEYTADITLAEDEILICAHTDEVDYKSLDNFKKVRDLEIGQVLTLDGIDLTNGTREFGSYIIIEEYPEEEEIEGDVFWVTHFNNRSPEGAGVIFTGTYDGCGWWLHVAFQPVAGLDGVYEVVAKDLTGNGGAKPLDIPKGGFVWACNGGNDYITIEGDETRLNYTNDASKKAMALARTMQIGDKYVFSGLNLNTYEVPTTTPNIDWFDPDYVCTAKYAPYEPEKLPTTGKDYTTTAPNRGDGWDDDGVRLTDGIKGTADGGATDGTNGIFAGWGSSDKTQPNVVEVVVDLGAKEYTDTYTVYLTGGNWGIKLPSDVISIEVLVSDSADGEFVSVASAPVGRTKLLSGSGVDGEYTWSTYSITAAADKPVEAQYIKYVVTHAVSGNGVIWMDEVEAELIGDPSADPEPDPEPEYKPGDVNADGSVDSADYLIVKRACFNSYTLSEAEEKRANVDGSDKVDSVDYVMVKRIAFGTYTVN